LQFLPIRRVRRAGTVLRLFWPRRALSPRCKFFSRRNWRSGRPWTRRLKHGGGLLQSVRSRSKCYKCRYQKGVSYGSYFTYFTSLLSFSDVYPQYLFHSDSSINSEIYECDGGNFLRPLTYTGFRVQRFILREMVCLRTLSLELTFVFMKKLGSWMIWHTKLFELINHSWFAKIGNNAHLIFWIFIWEWRCLILYDLELWSFLTTACLLDKGLKGCWKWRWLGNFVQLRKLAGIWLILLSVFLTFLSLEVFVVISLVFRRIPMSKEKIGNPAVKCASIYERLRRPVLALQNGGGRFADFSHFALQIVNFYHCMRSLILL